MAEELEYMGKIYRVHPQKGYYFATTKGTTFSLHREIYKTGYGDIPAGFEVHHKDFNKLNNAIENLELISSRDHRVLHGNKCWQDSDWIARLNKTWDSENHISRSGLMRLNLKKRQENYLKKQRHVTCIVCGNSTLNLGKESKKYCSGSCKTKAWKKRHLSGGVM